MPTVSYRPVLPEGHGAEKYRGSIASGYDAKREDSPKWTAEQRIITGMMDDILEGSWVLDIPVGTGRFLPYYRERKFCVRAMDLSGDMLDEARKKDSRLGLTFTVGDVRDLKIPDKCVDVSVMCRLTRWLSPEDCVKALRELQRVTRQRIIFTARVRNHPHARPYELINLALDGWHIARDEAGYHEDYRILCCEPNP